MGTNAGTGYPLFFMCAKCRVKYGGISRAPLGHRWVLTGMVRPLAKSQRGYGHPLALQHRVQYRCLDCGHVGWSRHVDAIRRAKKGD